MKLRRINQFIQWTTKNYPLIWVTNLIGWLFFFMLALVLLYIYSSTITSLDQIPNFFKAQTNLILALFVTFIIYFKWCFHLGKRIWGTVFQLKDLLFIFIVQSFVFSILCALGTFQMSILTAKVDSLTNFVTIKRDVSLLNKLEFYEDCSSNIVYYINEFEPIHYYLRNSKEANIIYKEYKESGLKYKINEILQILENNNIDQSNNKDSINIHKFEEVAGAIFATFEAFNPDLIKFDEIDTLKNKCFSEIENIYKSRFSNWSSEFINSIKNDFLFDLKMDSVKVKMNLVFDSFDKSHEIFNKYPHEISQLCFDRVKNKNSSREERLLSYITNHPDFIKVENNYNIILKYDSYESYLFKNEIINRLNFYSSSYFDFELIRNLKSHNHDYLDKEGSIYSIWKEIIKNKQMRNYFFAFALFFSFLIVLISFNWIITDRKLLFSFSLLISIMLYAAIFSLIIDQKENYYKIFNTYNLLFIFVLIGLIGLFISAFIILFFKRNLQVIYKKFLFHFTILNIPAFCLLVMLLLVPQYIFVTKNSIFEATATIFFVIGCSILFILILFKNMGLKVLYNP